MSYRPLQRGGTPPGPLNLLGASGLTWRHAFQLVFRPVRFLTGLSDRYGDLSFFRLFGHRAYFVNHPDLISEVLIYQADAFTKLPRQISVIREIFGQGILVSGGARWKRDRQHMQRAFGPHLRERNVEITRSSTVRMLERWEGKHTVSLIDEMTRLTAEIAIELCISRGDPDTADRMSEAVMLMSEEFAHEMNSIFHLPGWIPSLRRKRKLASMQAFFELIDREIESRRAATSDQADDLLQYLLDTPVPHGAGDNFIRDQLLTILVAAFHASSMALVWIFLLLDQHPEIGQKLFDGLAALEPGSGPESLLSVEYLDCVVRESLRLYPPAWSLFARESIRDVELGGYIIPAGGWFYISPLVTQRRECLFADAMCFQPERFLPENRKDISRNAWFPFGLGGHSCIGSNIAMDQLRVVVGTILENVLLRRDDKKMPDASARLVLRPVEQVTMTTRESPLKAIAEDCGDGQSEKRGRRGGSPANVALDSGVAQLLE